LKYSFGKMSENMRNDEINKDLMELLTRADLLKEKGIDDEEVRKLRNDMQNFCQRFDSLDESIRSTMSQQYNSLLQIIEHFNEEEKNHEQSDFVDPFFTEFVSDDSSSMDDLDEQLYDDIVEEDSVVKPIDLSDEYEDEFVPPEMMHGASSFTIPESFLNSPESPFYIPPTDEVDENDVEKQPAQYELNPSGEQSSPYDEQPNPMGQQQEPMGQQQEPMGQQQEPMGRQQEPMGQQQEPMGQQQYPIGQQPYPMGQQQEPMGQQQYPMGQQPYPMWQQPYPMGQQQYPMGQQQEPMGQQQYPMGQQPYPMWQQPYPMGQQQYPMGQQQYPMGQQPYPMGQQSYPMWQQPYPMGQQQYPMGQQSYPMWQQPYPMGQQQTQQNSSDKQEELKKEKKASLKKLNNLARRVDVLHSEGIKEYKANFNERKEEITETINSAEEISEIYNLSYEIDNLLDFVQDLEDKDIKFLEKEKVESHIKKAKSTPEENASNYKKKAESLYKKTGVSVADLIEEAQKETINYYISDYNSEIYQLLHKINVDQLGTNGGFLNLFKGGTYSKEIKELYYLSYKRDKVKALLNNLSSIPLNGEIKSLSKKLLKKPNDEVLRTKLVRAVCKHISKYIDNKVVKKKPKVAFKYSKDKRNDYLQLLRSKSSGRIIGLTGTQVLEATNSFDYTTKK